MKSLFFVLLAAVMLFLAFSALRARPSKTTVAMVTANTAAPAVADHGPRAPVVVELFTSEGCSSCPPADALLTQLEQLSGVIVLSEHVDYWNYIGWSDPYSSEAYSARQQAYAQALRLTGGRGDVYTPQMVVDGQFDFVGSNAAQARDAIAKAAALPKAGVQITALAAPEKDAVKLRIQASQLPQLHANDQAEVLLALTESNLASSVTRGENSGRKLRHSAVTRELRALGPFAAAQNTFEMETVIKLADTWKRADLRAVAFVQERAHRRILGAASIKLN